MKKIQYLKHKKITWPRDFGGDNIWVISVDGTHVWLFEPSHPKFLKIANTLAINSTKRV